MTDQLFSVADRVVLVTGGSRGLGRAMCNTVIVEARESGVWTRPWEIFGISLEPSGEAYDDQDAVFFEVRDGLICQTRVYITNNCARIYQIDKRFAELAEVGSE